MAEGIEVRHGKDCRAHAGGRCNCRPSYRASVWSQRERKKVKKTFPTEAAAKAWRADALVGLRKGTLTSPKPITVRQAAEAYLKGMEDGTIRASGGDPYKPSSIRDYRMHIQASVLKRFGDHRLGDIRHVDLQDWVDEMVSEGLSPEMIRGAIKVLRVIYRRAAKRGELGTNPAISLDLPAVRGRRDRIAAPDEADALIAALPTVLERALWATALYAGLRLGELGALRWEDVDLAEDKLKVQRSWDHPSGTIVTPKTRAGVRTVPVVPALRDLLLDLRLDQAKDGTDHGYVFGVSGGHGFGDPRKRTPDRPFSPDTMRNRAARTWKAAGLTPIGFHECRHTAASIMIAAMAASGTFNPKVIQEAMGHSNIAMTYDRYGHLMPGDMAQLAKAMDDYLRAAADERARLAQLDDSA